MFGSLILGVTLAQRLSLWYVILGMVLIVIGISLYILSRRFAAAIRKNDNIEQNDKALVAIRIVAMVFFIIGVIVFILP